MYWTSITRLLHHLRTEKARLTIWLFTSGITFLLLYFFWEPKVRSFPKELVRIERMADTRPAAALQELERYDTTKCMPGAITYYHFIALKTRYQLQPAYRIAPSELTKLVIDLEYLDPTPAQQADLYYYAGNMALRGNDITQSQGYLFKALALYERNGNTQMVERCYQQMERILEKRKTIKATERTMDDTNSYNFVGEEQRLRKEKNTAGVDHGLCHTASRSPYCRIRTDDKAMEPQKAGGNEEIRPRSGVAQKDRGGAGAAETTTGRARGTIAGDERPEPNGG